MTAVAVVRRGIGEVWWLHPAKLGIFFLIPLYTLLFLTPELFGPGTLNLKFFIYFTWKYYWIGLAFLIVLTNGALIGSLDFRVRSEAPTLPPLFSRYYLDLLALLTVFAYLVWYRAVFIDPSAILALIKGQPGASYAIRTTSRTIGGITTLTQFGGAYAVLYLHQIWVARVSFESKRYALYFYMITALAIFRVYAWSERLAFIELMVPIAVMYVVYRVPRTMWTRTITPALPFIGIAALFFFFGLTEYFRSWQSHYQYESTTFWGFVERRLVSYYYTALNNGAGMLTVYDWPSWRLNNVLGWLYRFPLLVGQIVTYLVDLRRGDSFLERYADPEYNNPSGIFVVFLDMGVVGGLALAAVMGWLAGYFWRCLVRGRGPGIFYPIVFLSLLEIFRLFYIGEPRAFPTLLALALAYLFFRQRHPKAAGSVDPGRTIGVSA